MWCSTRLCPWTTSFLLYVNDIHNSTNVLDINLFADDSNIFYANKSLSVVETTVNSQIPLVYNWLCANKLSLNIEKTNYIIFHPPQKKINYQMKVSLNGNFLKQEYNSSYLGIVVDCHLNWKAHVARLSKKIRRNIGVISKVRHFVNKEILLTLYYTLIHPYLIYGLPVWGNTYYSTVEPLFILQKKIVRLMTFSSYYEHTNNLLIKLDILKLSELVTYQNVLFVYDFFNHNLPEKFNTYFLPVSQKHKYDTRYASRSSYSLPLVRTNYGKFNIRFCGAKFWNEIDDEIKKLNRSQFKKKIKQQLLLSYIK